MKLSWRNAIALVLTGLVLGGVASAVAQDPEPGSSDTPDVELAHGGPRHFRHGLVRSESVIEREEGVFVTVRVDRGVLQGVEDGTLAIEEADGENVRVATSDETNFWKDGEEAEIGDLERGDHVGTFREKREDGDYVTRRVIAISPERYEELEQRREDRREACRENPERCRAGLRMRGRMTGDRMLDEGLAEIDPAMEASPA